MRKEKMVTRTIDVSTVTCLVADITNNRVIEMEVNVNSLPNSEKKQISVIENIINSDEMKFISIKSVTTSSQVYGMTETEFMTMAKKINR